jgi:hypothetical protein
MKHIRNMSNAEGVCMWAWKNPIFSTIRRWFVAHIFKMMSICVVIKNTWTWYIDQIGIVENATQYVDLQHLHIYYSLNTKKLNIRTFCYEVSITLFEHVISLMNYPNLFFNFWIFIGFSLQTKVLFKHFFHYLFF